MMNAAKKKHKHNEIYYVPDIDDKKLRKYLGQNFS